MKLLVCVDGSVPSNKAIEKAIEIASGCRVDQITLISVYEKYPLPLIEHASYNAMEEEMDHYEEMNKRVVTDHEAILDKASRRFKNEGLTVETLLQEGHPADTIAQTAEKLGVDMIIMGNRGRGGLKKLLLGSVSNAVIQETRVSVLVVK